MEVVNSEDKFARFGDHWSPKIIAALNDYHIKAARLLGEFVWHRHDDTDELFLVTKGSLAFKIASSRSGRANCWWCPRAWSTCRLPQTSARYC